MYSLVLTSLLILALLAIGSAVAWLLLTPKMQRLSFLERLMLLFFVGIILSGANWIVGQFVVFDRWLGGDAIRGKIVGDSYFLGRGSEEYTEVSRELYWFSYWYHRASALTIAVCWGGFFGTFLLAKRRRRSGWLRRVRALAERHDLESLYELIELIDDPVPFSGRKASEDLRTLSEAIRTRTERIAVPATLELSPDATPEERKRQKEVWRDWVEEHEAELSQHHDRGAHDMGP
jgi:hypothetical protein